ncbi:MAG TPA: bifunctional 23S rRNA (guanine(2069)-N(7))-methyltransferase RlmK/23S rRNA (guanine(2445)-N(2))-methyltransferase RlmL [Steroidobacteraceae bacterium]
MNAASRPLSDCVASVPRGFSDLLARELTSLGAADVRERAVGVEFRGELATVYRVCLESRLASRVFLVVARFAAPDTDTFYAAAREIDWSEHLAPGASLACVFSGRHPTISHSHFGALKLKDAICDQLREERGSRPDVVLERPSVRIHAHANGTDVTLSVDLAGEGLHRRGYRTAAGEAPLRENVAAGVLIRAGWPDLAAGGAEFLDPLCGSGTLVIEAAWIADNVAPGLRRDYFGFLGWAQHDASLWERVRAAARARIAPAAAGGLIRGRDRDARVLSIARDNARRAGVESRVVFETGDLASAAPATDRPGLLVANPPYGVRLEDRDSARAVHHELGRVLRERFLGWRAAVLTGAPEFGLEMGLRAHRTHKVWNGALECRLLRIEVEPAAVRELDPRRRAPREDAALRDSPGAKMFANRIAKNLKRLRSWVAREQISCYRMYDADMPEYSFAIDRYRGAAEDLEWLNVQEYAAPASILEDAVRRRRGEALAALPQATGVPAERIHMRTRRRTPRGEQYSKQADAADFHVVEEGGLRFEVNFTDYLDTGLFLDHRITRARLRAAANGARFLNLFGYTGSATVYAAAGGARATTTVDLSHTYLDWAQRNLTLNGLAGPVHRLVHADCREWLEESRRSLAGSAGAAGSYDLIFLDPPTFSNSKRMEGVLDTQRDHAQLIEACAALLAPGGLLVFSTNAQRFRFDESLSARFAVVDISRATIPPDFERSPRIHRCFEIRARAADS